MKHTDQLPDRRHFTDLAHEAVWIADEQTRLDTEHAQALSRLGFGFSGWRVGNSRPAYAANETE